MHEDGQNWETKKCLLDIHIYTSEKKACPHKVYIKMLFIITSIWKQLKVQQMWVHNRNLEIHTTEYYSAIKCNEL